MNGYLEFDSTCTSCVTCCDATKLLEIVHIFQSALIYHNPYCGWLPSDSHYLSFFHIHFHFIVSTNFVCLQIMP